MEILLIILGAFFFLFAFFYLGERKDLPYKASSRAYAISALCFLIAWVM